MKACMILGAAIALAAASTPMFAAEPAGLKAALDDERIGLLPASEFQLGSGSCTDCPGLKQALWYFKDEVLALPRAAGALPSPVWLGAPHILDGVAILPTGRELRMADGSASRFQLVPKIATNLSYWDASTTSFFASRPVRMRGSLREQEGGPAFLARTVWPKDFVIDPAKVTVRPFAPGESFTSFVREAGGGASSPFATRLLWERTPGQARAWQGKPVIGVMLNGAQGDDDEAFGGHFAIATGQLGKQGEWSDWLVNNFYNLDSVSEKGIIAAPVPMDNYLMDLNSGQQYYRPSYMLVAVLNQARTAAAYQANVQHVFERFYRHDFTYRHAGANCAGISLDVFKALGWNVPQRGPTSTLKAIGAYAYVAATEMSLASGRQIYDYLTEEQVRLYPAVAFEAAGNDLLHLLGAGPGAPRALNAFEKQLQSDVEALVLVRIPQIPSSRAMGSNPVFSFDEFMARTPPDRADWKIVPVAARPFPDGLRDQHAAVEDAPSPVPLPVAGILASLVFAVWALLRRRRKHA